MCLDKVDPLSPVARAFLDKRHAKVCIRGGKSLLFHAAVVRFFRFSFRIFETKVVSSAAILQAVHVKSPSLTAWRSRTPNPPSLMGLQISVQALR